VPALKCSGLRFIHEREVLRATDRQEHADRDPFLKTATSRKHRVLERSRLIETFRL
jgi:hypothetical protein